MATLTMVASKTTGMARTMMLKAGTQTSESMWCASCSRAFDSAACSFADAGWSEQAPSGPLRCCRIRCMRTTLDIDDDVLRAAKERARRERRSAGSVLSELARRGLTATSTAGPARADFGFEPLRSRGGVVTNALIDELAEDLD